jgi:RNA polymerase sporulation-specific sigma factor
MSSKKAYSKLKNNKSKKGENLNKQEEFDADSVEIEQERETKKSSKSKPSEIEDILFKLPRVSNPLIGTPKQVQTQLDKIAIYIRRHPDDHIENQALFDKMHLYMHGFLINVALKQFPYIKGLQTADIYQEALIALRFKAINGFRRGRGMSFLNFAKMCIRRHLITILNASKTRLKDQSINQAISLDSSPNPYSEDSQTFANIIPDGSDSVDEQTENQEAYDITLKTLCKTLSSFEQEVLNEYLTSSSYSEIAEDLSSKTKKRHPTKSVDNALVRIRNKAQKLKEGGKMEDIPLFII